MLLYQLHTLTLHAVALHVYVTFDVNVHSSTSAGSHTTRCVLRLHRTNDDDHLLTYCHLTLLPFGGVVII